MWLYAGQRRKVVAMRDLRYLTDHYDEKIDRIKKINAPINFVFITDQHNRMNSYTNECNAVVNDDSTRELAVDAIRSIQYILDRCPGISCVISGGDVGNDYYPESDRFKTSVEEVYDALYGLSVPVHNLIGNHDDGLGTANDRGWNLQEHYISPEEMHAICMKNNPTKENYYYVDIDPGYRFVFLNSIDLPYVAFPDGNWTPHWMLALSDKQVRWFEEEALKTDRKILVFSHAPLHNFGIVGEGMPLGIKPYDDTLNAPRILYDIAGASNVVANICGHVHYDNVVYTNSLLTITTLCSLVQEWAPGCPKREIGTITETAFDVFSIKDDMIYMTRFGAGRDREAMIIGYRHAGF